MRTILALFAGIAILASGMVFPAWAGSSTVSVQVRATILPWMQFSTKQHRYSYHVTDEDIRRGYLDLPHSLTVDLATNIIGVIDLGIFSNGPGDVIVGEAGAPGGFKESLRIENMYPGMASSKVMDIRVMLSAGMQPGAYPLDLTITPLVN
jgi:hypothetical protein